MKKLYLFLVAVFVLVVAPGVAFACDANEIDVLGDGTQCETAHFTLTTTSTDSFQFAMSAAGTFYVDCGNGGTLKQGSTTLSNKTISRGSSTSNTTYTCTWNAADTQTIRFGGTATDYNTNTSVAAISFYTNNTNAKKVYSIAGDLGKIFGAVQSGRAPSFYRTFYNCSKITAIPSGLFDSINTSNATNTSYMFSSTFYKCNLTSIPSGLFDSINTSNATNTSSMFFYTFYGCSNLTSIPSGLFDSIDTSNATNTSYMFQNTFYNCSKITAIPSGLFDSINTSNATNTSYMFSSTFYKCNLTSIPSGLFDSINTGSSTDTCYMFSYTFNGCSNLTAIPSGLFDSIDTSNATNTRSMFYGTFYKCSKITSMPASLFNSNINMEKATNSSNMFYEMFRDCTSMTGYIPSTTFPDGITAALNASSNVFYNTQLVTTCPGGTQLYATYTPNSKVACDEPLPASECSAGQYLPANTSECAVCPINNICAGGIYAPDTTNQGITPCESGTFAPTGSAVCYQHILHVGNDNIYLRSSKQTTPSLNIQIGENIFYANMTTVPTYMNKDSSHYLHILYEGDDYYVCDDTTCPQ